MKQADQPEPPAGRSQDSENLGQALLHDEPGDYQEADRRGEAEMKANGL